MKTQNWMMAVAALVACLASVAVAQDKPKSAVAAADERLAESTPNLMTNPDVWLYLHEEKRADDPKLAVRRAAEFDMEQRKARIATRKWLGISNSRPIASSAPSMGTYSARWAGNSYNPDLWTGVGEPTRVLPEVNVIEYRR